MNIVRMEKVNLKKARCVAKVVGTLVTVAGAMLMTLYKGRVVEMIWTKHMHLHGPHAAAAAAADKDWFTGSIFLIIATLAWASLFILQVCASSDSEPWPAAQWPPRMHAARLTSS